MLKIVSYAPDTVWVIIEQANGRVTAAAREAAPADGARGAGRAVRVIVVHVDLLAVIRELAFA